MGIEVIMDAISDGIRDALGVLLFSFIFGVLFVLVFGEVNDIQAVFIVLFGWVSYLYVVSVCDRKG